MSGDNMKELHNGDFRFNVSTPTKFEIIKEGEVKWLRFGGTCLEPTISRNDVKYTIDNINELDGTSAKFFVTHDLTPQNSIGHVKFRKEGDKLRYEARVRNTVHHPEIIESISENRVDVSIDARYNKMWSEKEGDTEIFMVSELEPRGLCAVGVGGVQSNTIEYAIAEEFKKKETKNEEPEINENEVKHMDEKMTQVLKENEELKSKVSEMEKENKLKEQEVKSKVVSNIVSLNKALDTKALMEKEIEVLNMMYDYEKKLSVKEEEAKEPEPVVGEPAAEPKVEKEVGSAEVEDKPEVKPKEEASGIVESDGSITMNEALHKKFNKEIRNMLPR